MTRATAILSPGIPASLAPAGNISFEIEAASGCGSPSPKASRSRFHLLQPDDARELLSMHSSRP